jgi:hypothetical protein
VFAACAGDAGDAGDACAACADDADDADDADGDHEIQIVDAFRDALLKMVSASGRAAAVAAVAAETVVEAPARGAQLSPVRERCSSWRADGEYEKRVDGFRDARLKLVSASGRAAAVAAVARKTVVEAPARGAQLIPVRERCSTWRGSGSRRYSADNCALHKTGEHRAFFGEFLVVNFFGACIEISTSVLNLVAFGYMYMN